MLRAPCQQWEVASIVRYMTSTMSVTLPHFLLQPFHCSLLSPPSLLVPTSPLSLSPSPSLPLPLSQRPVGLRRETCHKFRLITSSSFFQFSLRSIFSAKQIDFELLSRLVEDNKSENPTKNERWNRFSFSISTTLKHRDRNIDMERPQSAGCLDANGV